MRSSASPWVPGICPANVMVGCALGQNKSAAACQAYAGWRLEQIGQAQSPDTTKSWHPITAYLTKTLTIGIGQRREVIGITLDPCKWKMPSHISTTPSTTCRPVAAG